jgi:hypothetical protein
LCNIPKKELGANLVSDAPIFGIMLEAQGGIGPSLTLQESVDRRTMYLVGRIKHGSDWVLE